MCISGQRAAFDDVSELLARGIRAVRVNVSSEDTPLRWTTAIKLQSNTLSASALLCFFQSVDSELWS